MNGPMCRNIALVMATFRHICQFLYLIRLSFWFCTQLNTPLNIQEKTA